MHIPEGMARFLIEGEWSGYSSSQQRVVHRRVHPASDRKLYEWVKANPVITYTDGTSLLLRVRACKPRERIKDEINGYTSLIQKCFEHNVTRVVDLPPNA